jgi:hypothetical protein
MNTEELKITVLKALDLFIILKNKYPALAGNLVFSSPRGQCHLTRNVLEIFKTFPDMISDSPQKEKASSIVQSIVVLEKERKNATADVKDKTSEKIKKLTGEVNPLLDPLELRDDTFVEIRFDAKKVNLPLIFELQKDEQVSQEHTPQSKASVRIVLGTMRDLR